MAVDPELELIKKEYRFSSGLDLTPISSPRVLFLMLIAVALVSISILVGLLPPLYILILIMFIVDSLVTLILAVGVREHVRERFTAPSRTWLISIGALAIGLIALSFWMISVLAM